MKSKKPYPSSRFGKIIKIAKQIQEKKLHGNTINKWNLLQLVKKHLN